MWWMLAGLAWSAPFDLTVARGDANALIIRLDGPITVVQADHDHLAVHAEGGAGIRLRERDGVWHLTGREAVTAATVYLPDGVVMVGLHERVGPAEVLVPARVAVVSHEGAVTVRGAESLRVSYLRGDLVVADVTGDVHLDHVDGAVQQGAAPDQGVVAADAGLPADAAGTLGSATTATTR